VIPQRKGDPKVFKVDERPLDTTLRRGATGTGLQEDGNRHTGGERIGHQHDGACAVVVASADKAKELGLKPMVKIKGFASAASIRPTWASDRSRPSGRVMKKLNLTIKDFDLFELNEAFAVQALGCIKELGSPSTSAT
jgi:acetyl-CoA C-acetyltransferase